MLLSSPSAEAGVTRIKPKKSRKSLLKSACRKAPRALRDEIAAKREELEKIRGKLDKARGHLAEIKTKAGGRLRDMDHLLIKEVMHAYPDTAVSEIGVVDVDLEYSRSLGEKVRRKTIPGVDTFKLFKRLYHGYSMGQRPATKRYTSMSSSEQARLVTFFKQFTSNQAPGDKTKKREPQGAESQSNRNKKRPRQVQVMTEEERVARVRERKRRNRADQKNNVSEMLQEMLAAEQLDGKRAKAALFRAQADLLDKQIELALASKE